jgi:hemoglobin
MTGIRVGLLLVFSGIMVGAAGATSARAVEDSLYKRLGGRETIRAIVSDFVDMTRKDARIRMNTSCKISMDTCKPEEVKANLTTIVCQESGGPCNAATAKAAMAKLVSKMEFSEGEWSAMRDDFSAALILFKAHDKSVH